MVKVKALIAIIIVGIALLLMVGCASPAEPLTTEPDFYGFITEVRAVGNNNVVGTIAVESHADKIVDKYVITVKNTTSLFRQDGEVYYEISFDGLEAKQWLKIWFDGPVMESWPMQARALQVVIIQ